MKKFGQSFGDNDTPVNEICQFCEEVFIENDAGVSLPYLSEKNINVFIHYHKNCFLRTIVGSVGHQNKECSCYGGKSEDPVHLSLREAANQAVLLFQNSTR